MKLGNLINAQQSFLNLSKVKKGSLAIRLLSIKRSILPRIEDFNTLRNNKIKELSPNGNLSVESDPEKFKEATEYIEEMLNAEVNPDWPTININELNDIEISMEDLESLLNANIVVEE